jgi:hypothetical protein
LERVDAGEQIWKYEEDYWKAEVLLYARTPVSRFVDIGTGPGYLLDAITMYLPASSHRFYGVERFPPAEEFRTKHENYIIAELRNVRLKFQAGVCIEVLEHLTPKMARRLGEDLATISEPGSIYIFNTGLVDYVEQEDPGYLDPFRRGHLISWSVEAVSMIFGPFGFSVLPIPGKAWAFIVEYKGESLAGENLVDRIWTARQENVAILNDPIAGSVLHVLGLDTARAYR